MGMTPEDYYWSFLTADYEDWEKTPSSVRLAFHLAVTTFHLGDHFWKYYRERDVDFAAAFPSLSSFHTRLARISPRFRTLQSVATVYKHLHSWEDYDVSSAGSITSVTDRNGGLEEQYLNEGGDDVLVRRRDGSQVSFSEVVVETRGLWDSIIAEGPAFFLAEDQVHDRE